MQHRYIHRYIHDEDFYDPLTPNHGPDTCMYDAHARMMHVSMMHACMMHIIDP